MSIEYSSYPYIKKTRYRHNDSWYSEKHRRYVPTYADVPAYILHVNIFTRLFKTYSLCEHAFKRVLTIMTRHDVLHNFSVN